MAPSSTRMASLARRRSSASMGEGVVGFMTGPLERPDTRHGRAAAAPSPLVGEGWGGGSHGGGRQCYVRRPPPPTPPHKGEGSRLAGSSRDLLLPRPHAEQVTDRKDQIGAVHRVEMKIR